MSRFLRPSVTVVPLGPCGCPGTPHEQDEVVMHTVIGWDDLVDIGLCETEGAGQRLLVTKAIKRWNLVDDVLDEEGVPTGEVAPVPVTEEAVRLLEPETLTLLATAANDAYQAARRPLPNASGAPSRPSRRGSASRTRK